jgi:hypothetical protein
MTLKYSNVESFVSAGLSALGTYSPLPVFDPGPTPDLDALDLTGDRLVIISIAPGGGMAVENIIDRVVVQVRSIGAQMDYADAEQLAQDIDHNMLSLDVSQFIDGLWVVSISRVGGGPALLVKDSADRYNFTCSYIWEVEYG